EVAPGTEGMQYVDVSNEHAVSLLAIGPGAAGVHGVMYLRIMPLPTAYPVSAAGKCMPSNPVVVTLTDVHAAPALVVLKREPTSPIIYPVVGDVNQPERKLYPAVPV